MAGILDDLVGAVGAVATTAAAGQDPTTSAARPQQTEDRLAALEQFAITFGPMLEKLAPLLEKLEGL